MTATYVPGTGTLVTLQGASEGITFTLREHTSVAAIERYLREIEDYLGIERLERVP